MILSLGSLNADFQLRASRWPHPGETLPGREFALLPGGKAANVAYVARRLGVQARLLARVGSDPLAPIALSGPEEIGVDLAYVSVAQDAPTGAAMIVVRADGEKTILLAGNANDAWPEGEREAVLRAIDAAPADAVLVVDLEVPVALVERAAARARERGHAVVLDPSPAHAMSERLYALSDVLTPNAGEAARLAGVEDLEAAARRLQERAPRAAAAVKAPHGDCLLASGGRVRRLHGIRAHAVDATGAGDAFAGSLAVGLFEKRPIEQCVLMAMAAASCAVERYGSQAAYPDRATLAARLQALERANAP